MKLKATIEIMEKAELMIKQGERAEAEKLLKKLVAGTPPDWKPVQETSFSIDIAYWNREEFLIHALNYDQGGEKRFVTWKLPSYSKAFYLLAFLKVEQKE